MLEESRLELQEQIADLLQRLQRAERAMVQPEARAALQEQRSQLQEAAREVRSVHWQPIEVKRTPWQEKLGSGDRVFIRGIPRPVEVISSPDDEGQVEVLLGTMRAKIPTFQLERPAAGHEPAARQGVYFNRPSIRHLNTEVDLRGLRVDEALSKVDDLLNNAALGGVEAVRIIHGKGTGVLRRSIREYLTRHSLAGSIAPGDGSGGDGVTVVELK
jgi:DNA mismatch repair protein MutS2